MGHFSFPYDQTTHSQNWGSWSDGFTLAEINKIIALGDRLRVIDAAIAPDTVADGVNIVPSSETEWLYQRLCAIAMEINNQYFGFAITGVEDLKYVTSPAESEPSVTEWHIDRAGINGKVPRKLSVVLQLSDPQNYEGGEQWIHGINKVCFPKVQGNIYAYPAYTLHRSTLVTLGTKKTLVAYFTGPDFA